MRIDPTFSQIPKYAGTYNQDDGEKISASADVKK